jgi:hypothetical protein
MHIIIIISIILEIILVLMMLNAQLNLLFLFALSTFFLLSEVVIVPLTSLSHRECRLMVLMLLLLLLLLLRGSSRYWLLDLRLGGGCWCCLGDLLG